jgi:hypothetical protein
VKEKLERSEIWRGMQDDLQYEISHHSLESNNGKGVWCYYVYVPADALSPEDFERLWLKPTGSHSWGPSYDEYSLPIANCEWHGGITYYEKTQLADSDRRSIKIGCDFNHYFDHEDGLPYSVDRVAFEARATITAMREAMKFKRRDSWVGGWDYPENMTEHEGQFYTTEGLAKRQEWEAENKARKAFAGD